ncbi:hypothetical protein HSIEG1_104 [Enterococcus sp. HSIEG1]|nr:hypothetical protein HSIEG1_104 [Enterococcus sp. HSIEG1]
MVLAKFDQEEGGSRLLKNQQLVFLQLCSSFSLFVKFFRLFNCQWI